MNFAELRRTDRAKHLLLIRLIAALPLIGIGLQHLTGAAPLAPILEGAGIPFPELNALVAPVFQLLAGGLLALGLLARFGGMLAATQMVVALYTHVVFDWTEEPPLLLPVAVFAASLMIVWRGAGPLSLDRAATTGHGDPVVVGA